MGENFGLFKSFGDRLFEGELPTNLGLIGSTSVNDTDVTAFFNRVTAAGGTLTATEQDAINTLVFQLKAAGAWTGMKAIYPMVGSSAAACAQNLRSASFTGTFTSGWTFASTGVTPNGTSAYMDTFYNSSIDGNLNDGFIGTYLRTNNAGTPSCDFGNYNGSNSAITIYARFSDSQLGRWNDVNDTVLTTTDSRGWRFVNRNSATTKNNGINATVVNTLASAISTINAKIYLSALSTNGSPSQYSNRECAFACLGNGLTDTQALNFYTAVQAFQITLGRQITDNDADAQAFFNRVTAAGGSLTATEQTAVNALVIDMKATGTWTGMKAIYPMVGGSAAACAQNLKSSSFTGTFYGGGTFTSAGYITNGSNQAMATGVIPSTNLTLYSNHISVYNKSAGGKNYVVGTYDDSRAAIALTIQGLTNFDGKNCIVSGGGASSTVANSLGFYLNSRIANNSMAIFKGSSKLNTTTTLASALQPSGGLCIGATSYNNDTAPLFGYSAIECSFSSIGDGLTDTQATNLYNSVQTFQTTLSRQV